MKQVFAPLFLALSSINALKDNGQYFIENKHFQRHRLAKWGSGERDFGTYSNSYHENQLWQLEPAGYGSSSNYYLTNVAYAGQRFGKWDSGKNFGCGNWNYAYDQVWNIYGAGGDYYYIKNKKYSQYIWKWGKDNGNIETGAWRRNSDSKFQWKFTPRYKATAEVKAVWQNANVWGSLPISETIKVTTGFTVTDSVTSKRTDSFSATISAGLEGIPIASIPTMSGSLSGSATKSITNELTKAHTSVKTGTRSSDRKFTAPAFRNYGVFQIVTTLKSPIPGDVVVYHGFERVGECAECQMAEAEAKALAL